MENGAHRALAGAALLALMLTGAALPAGAQFAVGGGYVVAEETSLEPVDVTADATDLQQNPNRVNVKAIGMGRTAIANGRGYNAMLENPALLSRSRFSIDLIGLQASVPTATVDAAKFVKDNQDQFTADGAFMGQIRDGLDAYQSATSLSERVDAIRQIRAGLVFPNELLDQTVGSQADPNTHGVSVIPNFQAQFGHFGVSLYGSGQIGFQVSPGNSIDTLLSVSIPDNASQLSPEIIRRLRGVVESAFRPDGTLDPEGLPQVFAMTYGDVVGAVGYARTVRPGLDLGANLKVIHRRFSTKNIDADNLDAILSEARNDLNESVTGVTVDCGALYHWGNRGTTVGLSAQNLLPLQKITSSADFSMVSSQSYYLTDTNDEPLVGFFFDRNGNPVMDGSGTFIPNAAGDTLLTVETQQITVQAPFRLKAPLLLNAGISHPVSSRWDVSADWVDILAQDDGHDGLASRIHVGTEYRLLNNLVAVRGGLAEKKVAVGAGISIKVLQLDAAYAYDNFVGDNAYFAQVKFGW